MHQRAVHVGVAVHHDARDVDDAAAARREQRLVDDQAVTVAADQQHRFVEGHCLLLE